MKLRYGCCGMNFVSAFYEREKRTKSRHMLVILCPILLIGTLLTAWMYLEMAGRRIERDRQQLLEAARVEKADMEAGNLSSARERANNMEAFCQNAFNVDLVLKSGGEITQEMLSAVMDLSHPRVTIENLEYRNGRLLCDAYSADYREASRYLERVAGAGIFEGLEYTGFHRRGDGYSFTITCRLAQGKAGTDNEAE